MGLSLRAIYKLHLCILRRASASIIAPEWFGGKQKGRAAGGTGSE
jgi:hypothetical protein